MAQLKNTIIDDTGFLQLPSGNSAQQPSSPTTGMFRYNTELGYPEYFTGDFWLPLNQTPITATGGNTVEDVTIDGETFRVHAFTSTGTSTFTVTEGIGEVEYLIVAGGGSGGCSEAEHRAGGGGAGGVLLGKTTVHPATYQTLVGSGGASRSGTSRTPGADGQNTTAFGLTAIGGGGGAGGSGGPARVGGSGGGGHYQSSPTTGAAGTAGQGNKGGDSVQSVGGGGGGGAGEPGFSNAAGPRKQEGGNGIYVNWADAIGFGDNGYFGGGGGSGENPSYGALGGLGGGGRGATTDTNNASPGQANTGGGGGGTRNGNSGAGGSGIILIRYRIG